MDGGIFFSFLWSRPRILSVILVIFFHTLSFKKNQGSRKKGRCVAPMSDPNYQSSHTMLLQNENFSSSECSRSTSILLHNATFRTIKRIASSDHIENIDVHIKNYLKSFIQTCCCRAQKSAKLVTLSKATDRRCLSSILGQNYRFRQLAKVFNNACHIEYIDTHLKY